MSDLMISATKMRSRGCYPQYWYHNILWFFMKIHDFWRFQRYRPLKINRLENQLSNRDAFMKILVIYSGWKSKNGRNRCFWGPWPSKWNLTLFHPYVAPQIFLDSEREFYSLSDELYIKKILGVCIFPNDLERKWFDIEKNEKNWNMTPHYFFRKFFCYYTM